MWDALDIGSAPIQVLEPGCGTGNFMAGIPENIKANVSGVELDPISARIAAALNPDATILNADIAEKREMGGWDPRKDPLMRINAQGDWTGITQQQADQIVWDNRDEILTRASYDSELSTWTLHQLDQLKEPQPAQSLDRDRPEPDHKAPAQADSTTKRHGPRL